MVCIVHKHAYSGTLQAAAEVEALGAQQAHEQQMDESELAHMSELAELRDRVMELQSKDRHTPQELAELDMLRSRVLNFQVLDPFPHFFLPYPHSDQAVSVHCVVGNPSTACELHTSWHQYLADLTSYG